MSSEILQDPLKLELPQNDRISHPEAEPQPESPTVTPAAVLPSAPAPAAATSPTPPTQPETPAAFALPLNAVVPSVHYYPALSLAPISSATRGDDDAPPLTAPIPLRPNLPGIPFPFPAQFGPVPVYSPEELAAASMLTTASTSAATPSTIPAATPLPLGYPTIPFPYAPAYFPFPGMEQLSYPFPASIPPAAPFVPIIDPAQVYPTMGLPQNLVKPEASGASEQKPAEKEDEEVLESDPESDDEKGDDEKGDDENSADQFYCDECEYQTKRLGVLTRHKNKNHPGNDLNVTKPKRGQKFDENGQVKDLSHQVIRFVNENLKRKDKGTGPYRCRHCSKRYSTEDQLSSHKAIHDKGKKFACNDCDYKSKTHNALEKHLLTHASVKLFHCQLCDYETNYKDHLEGHLNDHNGVKAFECDQCTFKCNRKSHMSRHKLTHLDKKAFNCTQCDYSAHRKEHLETHMYKHQGIKPFKCPHCKFSCSDKTYLGRHIKATHA